MPQAHQSFKTLELSENKIDIVQKEIIESEKPQLVLKPRLVGICRSDIKEFLGTRTVRHDFGHEVLAEVVESNTKDRHVPRVGDLVVLDPHIKIQRTSGFGDLIVASANSESLSKAFIRVSSSVDDDKLVFTEPLACAHHCVANLLRFENMKMLRGLSIGIVGAGMTGALIGLLCKHYGATVTILNRSTERLDFLKKTSVFNEDETGLLDEVKQEFDVVIPTTTFLYPEVLNFCNKLVRDNGLILLYGGTRAGDVFPDVDGIDIDTLRRRQDMIEVDNGRKKFKLCGTHGALTEDFMAIVRLFENSPKDIPVEKLIGRRIKLDDVANTLLEMTKSEVLGKTIVSF